MFIFHSFSFGGLFGTTTPTADELTLSDQMIGYWSQFAATGDPNGGDALVWHVYGRNADNRGRGNSFSQPARRVTIRKIPSSGSTPRSPKELGSTPRCAKSSGTSSSATPTTGTARPVSLATSTRQVATIVSLPMPISTTTGSNVACPGYWCWPCGCTARLGRRYPDRPCHGRVMGPEYTQLDPYWHPGRGSPEPYRNFAVRRQSAGSRRRR